MFKLSTDLRPHKPHIVFYSAPYNLPLMGLMILECVHSHDPYHFRKWSLISLPQTSDFLLMIKVDVAASIHLLSLGHYKKPRLPFYSPVGHSLRGKPAANHEATSAESPTWEEKSTGKRSFLPTVIQVSCCLKVSSPGMTSEECSLTLDCNSTRLSHRAQLSHQLLAAGPAEL